MKPKGKLFALLAVFAAIGVVTATGAFTTVTASRTATVNVAGDSSALVAIESNDNDYAQVDSTTGQFELNLAGDFSDYDVSGLNLDAATSIEDVFTITNQGSEAVELYIEKPDPDDNLKEGAIAFAVRQGDLESGPTPNIGIGNGDYVRIDDSSSTVYLESGESITISLFIDTSDSDPSDGLDVDSSEAVGQDDEILDQVVIHADASDSATNYDRKAPQ